MEFAVFLSHYTVYVVRLLFTLLVVIACGLSAVPGILAGRGRQRIGNKGSNL